MPTGLDIILKSAKTQMTNFTSAKFQKRFVQALSYQKLKEQRENSVDLDKLFAIFTISISGALSVREKSVILGQVFPCSFMDWIFVEPSCGEQDIVVTTSVRCMCVRALCVRTCVRPSVRIFL